jgi:hypothetical protein
MLNGYRYSTKDVPINKHSIKITAECIAGLSTEEDRETYTKAFAGYYSTKGDFDVQEFEREINRAVLNRMY